MIIREALPNKLPLDSDGLPPCAQSSTPPTHHQVCCTNCKKIWPPIRKSQTTTTDYIRHYKKHHSGYPHSEEMEKEMICRMKNKRSKIQSTPWTTAASSSGTTMHRLGQPFNETTYRRLLTSSLVETNSSFRLVESKSFNKLMQYCNANTPTLSHQTVARDLRKMHDELKPMIKDRFQKHIDSGGHVNITLDAWTSGNKVPYLGITAHWMDSDYDLNDTVIGFKRLRGSHTAENLSSVLIHCLREFGLEEHIRCITSDNHIVNTVMFDIFANKFTYWKKKDGQVRCMAHVMNLSAQRIKQSLKAETLITETEASMAQEATPSERTNTPAGVLKMARRIASKIRASHLLSESLVAQISATKLENVKVLLDMKVRYVINPSTII